MELLKLTDVEREYMSRLSFFDKEYVDYLSEFQYKPSEQVETKFDEATGDFELEVSGKWHETILYEVPLLALISEAYFRFTDRDWNYESQVERAVQKTRALVEHGCVFSEFGTRRRRDFKTHDLVLKTIYETNEDYKQVCAKEGTTPKGNAAGTSNVFLAMKYNVPVIGTVGKCNDIIRAAFILLKLHDIQHMNSLWPFQHWKAFNMRIVKLWKFGIVFIMVSFLLP